MDWQPIETAPKEIAVILRNKKGDVWNTAKYYKERKVWICGNYPCIPLPTEWQVGSEETLRNQ